MSDTEARDKVLEEFTQGLFIWERPGERQYRMADEIVRQRQRADRAERILAALREPSVAVVDAAVGAVERNWMWLADVIRKSGVIAPAIAAAVAAAEREVDG